MKTRDDIGLHKAIGLAGGVSALAELLKVWPSTVSQWDRIPIKYVSAICEKWPGDITRAEIRPDYFGERS